MAAVLYEPAFVVVATWFDRHRARALTLLTVTGGLASTVFVPLAMWLLLRQGWRGALATLAVIVACVTIPIHALLLRHHPRDVGSNVDGDDDAGTNMWNGAAVSCPPTVLGDRAFWRLTTAFVASSIASVGLGVHLVAYLAEDGVPLDGAAGVVGLLGGSQIFGRLFYARIRRRFALEQALAAVLLLQAGALCVLAWSRAGAALLAFATAFGVANGLVTLLRASAIAETYDHRHYGRVSGAIAALTTFARALAPLAIAFAHARLNSYAPVVVALTLMLMTVAMMNTLGPQKGTLGYA
jgi:predicted MFS family arabinose efflux permease